MHRELPQGMSKEEYIQRQKEKAKLDESVYLNESINTLKADIQKLTSGIDEINANLESFKSYFSSHLNELEVRVNYSDHDIKGKIGDFSLLLDAHLASHRVLKEKSEAICDLYFGQEEELIRLNQSIKDVNEKFEKYRSIKEVERTQDVKVSDKKLECMANEIISRPTGFDELRKEIQDEIRLITLNGQNSILRCSNAEKEIHILEKRIEQIFLLLKRNKLDQGM